MVCQPAVVHHSLILELLPIVGKRQVHRHAVDDCLQCLFDHLEVEFGEGIAAQTAALRRGLREARACLRLPALRWNSVRVSIW